MKPTNSPNPRPTQPKKNEVKKWHLGNFFPTANIFFAGWDWFYIVNRLQETKPNQILHKLPNNTVLCVIYY